MGDVLHRSRGKALTLVAAFAALLSVSALAAPAARAAEPRGDVAAAAWTPSLVPFYGEVEQVYRNLNGSQRQFYLQYCPNGRVCLAVGEGDGQHTVYRLYRCTERGLTNFIDAGAIVNNQVGDAHVRLLGKNHELLGVPVPADDVKREVNWGPIWYIDVC
ncbi:hypothetical protein [Micromonospora sp. NPDC047074]|uniref:hypothetical protein n=1 Tax=Micromonospora sp. NPDC047074 TaxID=3154339 RepID=UPI00340B0FA0